MFIEKDVELSHLDQFDVMVKLSLCVLTERHAMKAYGGVEV
jgi:hypothetical protein